MKENYEERRKNGGFTDEQIDAIKEAILASIYQEIGKSLVRKALWLGGAIILAIGSWLAGSGHIKIPGASD
jgi:hypothetical protein